MSLRFFSDQCVPTEITETLLLHGHQVTLLREVLPIGSLDPVVIAKAQEGGEILLSLNGDFADIVAYPPADFLGILAIQLHNHPETIPQLMDRLWAFCARIQCKGSITGSCSLWKCIVWEFGDLLVVGGFEWTEALRFYADFERVSF